MAKSSAARPPTGSFLPRSTVKNTQTLLGFFWAELISLTLTPPQALAKSERAAVAARNRRWVRLTWRGCAPGDGTVNSGLGSPAELGARPCNFSPASHCAPRSQEVGAPRLLGEARGHRREL